MVQLLQCKFVVVQLLVVVRQQGSDQDRTNSLMYHLQHILGWPICAWHPFVCMFASPTYVVETIEIKGL